MSEAYKYFEKLLENRINEIHTAMPCKVESYDESKGIAKVIPLFKIKFTNQEVAQERPPFIDVPVIKQRFRLPNSSGGTTVTTLTPVYQPGDIVLVIFLERAYDMVKDGQVADPVYNRKHALDDPIIIGLL